MNRNPFPKGYPANDRHQVVKPAFQGAFLLAFNRRGSSSVFFLTTGVTMLGIHNLDNYFGIQPVLKNINFNFIGLVKRKVVE